MKCPKCGTNINNSTTICPTCGSYISQQDKDVQLASQNVTPQKTKSKMLAIILALFGLNDIYLLNFGRLFKRIIVTIFTLGIGAIIWQLYDTICIATGKINCDRNGTPLV